MNTLRVKIAVLMVVVIVSVVGVLTALVFYIFPPPKPERELNQLAQQIGIVTRLARNDPAAAALSPSPAAGRPDEIMTRWLRNALAERGDNLDIAVTRPWPDGTPGTISIPIGSDGWLLMPMLGPPPRGGKWAILFRWLALVTLGATAIAVLAARRMVQPLALLKSAVESVGPDATLPRLPERGPAEVRATAKALNSLSSRLKAAMESRMRLVAAAGHDLRTPITRMRLRAEFVENDEDRALWLRDLDELERIADSAILLVREESAKAPPELIRLDTLVADIVTELQEQKHDIRLAGSSPVSVRTGRLALSRALRNLMINAATHGVRAQVRVDAANDSARVTITDEGPGIPPELLDRAFEPFFRADPARRQSVAGAGLGLTIANEIIQRAGGRIDVANRAGGGLVQTITLPKLADAA